MPAHKQQFFRRPTVVDCIQWQDHKSAPQYTRPITDEEYQWHYGHAPKANTTVGVLKQGEQLVEHLTLVMPTHWLVIYPDDKVEVYSNQDFHANFASMTSDGKPQVRTRAPIAGE